MNGFCDVYRCPSDLDNSRVKSSRSQDTSVATYEWNIGKVEFSSGLEVG